MELILRDHVEHLGSRGQIVKVADGYARNYLLPRKLALLATEANKKRVERERKIAEAREAEERSASEAIAARLSALELTFTRKVGDTEQLYGSVTSQDIADAVKAKGFDVDRRKILLPDAIKAHRRVHRAGEAAPRRDRAAQGHGGERIGGARDPGPGARCRHAEAGCRICTRPFLFALVKSCSARCAGVEFSVRPEARAPGPEPRSVPCLKPLSPLPSVRCRTTSTPSGRCSARF